MEPNPRQWLVDKAEAALRALKTEAHWRCSAQQARDTALRMLELDRPLCADEFQRQAALFDEIADRHAGSPGKGAGSPTSVQRV